MKHLLRISLLLAFSLSVSAQTLQPAGIRIYRSDDFLIMKDSAGVKAPDVFVNPKVSVGPYLNTVRVTIDGASMYFPLGKFLKADGTPYSTVSLAAAVNAWTVANAGSRIDFQNVATFDDAKAAVTPGKAKTFRIANNRLYGAPTSSTYDGTNWFHSPSLLQNN